MAGGPILPPLPAGNELRLLILGKTGNGKSMTGNVILEEDRTMPKEKRPFEASGRGDPVTAKVQSYEKIVGGRKLVVVDTPGTMDPLNPKAPIREIASAIVKSPEGYDAFLLVLRYGRLTNEEIEAIHQVEKLFGSNFGKHAILLMTHGETFIHDNDLDDESYDVCAAKFQTYIRTESASSHPKSVARIIERIHGGSVLFNNLERDLTRKRLQIITLIQAVDRLPCKNRYRDEFFQLAQKELQMHKKPEVVTTIVAKDVEEKKGCFPANSLVIIYPGNKVPISEIKPGNQILCADLKGHVSYQQVYMLGHADINSIMQVLEIKTQSNVLHISLGHYLPVGEKNIFKKAREVEVGDVISVLDTTCQTIKTEEVISITQFTAQGRFCPFTMSGFIIVDGVLATCYEESGPVPNTSHFMLKVVKGLYKISPKSLEKINETKTRGVPTWAFKLSK